MLMLGTVFRKALGDGKRAIILQPDWAKVSAVLLKTRDGTFDLGWVLKPGTYRRFSTAWYDSARFGFRVGGIIHVWL